MKANKLSIAVVALLTEATIAAYALELYVGIKTQQVFSAPGKNRLETR